LKSRGEVGVMVSFGEDEVDGVAVGEGVGV
jgi:hypothetical protein